MVNPGADQVSGVEMYLSFDHTKLQLNSAVVNSSAFLYELTNTIDNNAGVAHIVTGVKLSPLTPVILTATFVTLNFQVIGTGQSDITINNNSFVTSLNESDNFITGASPAQVTIASRTYSLTDFQNIATHWLQSLSGEENGDYNSDIVVNTRDLGVIMHSWGN
jgi:hypothetical protein